MGYLLKEALKTLCGVNQWSYAVFWKIGCQNPKLLIWEDCYYETASCGNFLTLENAFHDYDASWVSAETRNLQSNVQAGDMVDLLVNKMMMDNQVNIVGEGLVGRVAFTGNHQWIQAENYYREAHPPEVQKEVCQQFSVGMQTVAVIPLLPHGVVQFGSFLTIMENMGFVNDVTSLLLQLGLSKECSPNAVDTQTSFSLTPTQILPQYYAKSSQPMKFDFSSANELKNGVAKAEVIPSNSEMWTNQNALRSIRCKEQFFLSNMPNASSAVLMHARITKPGLMYCSDDGNVISKNPNSSELKNVIFSKTEAFAKSESSAVKREIEQNTVQAHEVIPGFAEDDEKQKSGDNLFDVLGADFKNKLFSNCWNIRSSINESIRNVHNNLPSNTSQGNSESRIFSSTNSDHLLEAVVSKICPTAKQGLNDSVSCMTTSTNVSSLSEPNSSLPYGRLGISCSFTAGHSKEESGSYSQDSSIYGSQISSWIGKDQKGKQNTSVSTGYSKKPDETSKTSRKRLKPGENPRPRPKDRQMIQDRVKELREIVPNGAKCSIDSLLERTIKHMLFLQSVTKHADKLKQTGESKIISKDGGLLLKDNFEGGATWAYEVGSQSMVCPIIVEDLNQPRQMLVEMLCEERGLFLEIADIIRGLGLTILKGVMDTRNDKIWGRFAVEANRDVTRMEIFISLVRLLEQSSKNSDPQLNGISNENLMAQQFHQVAPIPVRSHSLQ